MIQSITPITSLLNTPEAQEARDVSGGFGDIFKMAIDSVKETEAEKNQLQYMMATGQLDNPAELSLAASKYELSVNLLVQLRNRALDAYNELMRISL